MSVLRSGRRNALTILGLVVLSVAHVAWRAAPKSRTTLSLSSIEAGTSVPRFTAELLAAGPGSASVIPVAGCRIVVAFSSTCQHCHTALSRSRDASRDGRLPVVWMADGRDKGAPKLGELLGPGDYLARSVDAWPALKVNAVPAAFLIGDDERIKRVWVYQGDEDPGSLRPLCRGA